MDLASVSAYNEERSLHFKWLFNRKMSRLQLQYRMSVRSCDEVNLLTLQKPPTFSLITLHKLI